MLSWVEPLKEGYTLRYAIRKGQTWSEPRTIATGRPLWRHPAEMPGMMSLPDGTLLAHWVEKGKDSSDAEDLYVSSSKDGLKWEEALREWQASAPADKDASEIDKVRSKLEDARKQLSH